jgi:hypothetical protein
MTPHNHHAQNNTPFKYISELNKAQLKCNKKSAPSTPTPYTATPSL